MDSQELVRRKSYMNIDLCHNPVAAFDIALSKGYINQDYFKKKYGLS